MKFFGATGLSSSRDGVVINLFLSMNPVSTQSSAKESEAGDKKEGLSSQKLVHKELKTSLYCRLLQLTDT